MGPRSDERGNIRVSQAARHRCPGLQWGRAQMSAEIHRDERSAGSGVRLQWGRAQMSAEISFRAVHAQPPDSALQWGRAQMSAEIRVRTRKAERGEVLQW